MVAVASADLATETTACGKSGGLDVLYDVDAAMIVGMTVAVVVFTRDLRVRDNPALSAAAATADHVVPVFVVDRGITRSRFNRPNRAAFLADSLRDLDASLKKLGAGLVVRHGDVATEVAELADEVDAAGVHMARDYSRYAVRRQDAVRTGLGRRTLYLHDSHVVIPPDAVSPTGGDYFRVFTPYHRRWLEAARRDLAPTPHRLRLPPGIRSGPIPGAADICEGPSSPALPDGGETAARRRMSSWYAGAIRRYPDDHDALAADNTSHLSAALHFGCISPLELTAKADRRSPAHDAFVRQVCWRDFNHQILAARPDVVDTDFRTQHDRWRHDEDDFAAWQEGRTGYPIVDAGMRQLQQEGWMHNRARLLTGSFLTKHLYIDWRWGARHFFDLLVDGDIANNTLNWQWIAGTGADSRPNRMLNPMTQAERHDPDGAYVRRYLGDEPRPGRIVDHTDAVRAFRAHRGRG